MDAEKAEARQPGGRLAALFRKKKLKEKFGQYDASDKEHDGKAKTKPGEEPEKEATPPKKIGELGDDAYWVGNRFGGVLYVLKGDCFISIGLGGTDDEHTKIEKSKVLAQKAVQRL